MAAAEAALAEYGAITIQLIEATMADLNDPLKTVANLILEADMKVERQKQEIDEQKDVELSLESENEVLSNKFETEHPLRKPSQPTTFGD